jgi:eukaryotic-like serine/threonine-protein kinase
MTSSNSGASARGWPAGSWWSALVVALSLTAIVLQIGFLLPWLSPAGHGVSINGDPVLVGSGDRETVMPRPPSSAERRLTRVRAVRDRSAAAVAGLHGGDRVLAVRAPDGQWIALEPPGSGVVPLGAWRDAYWLGPRGPLVLRFAGGRAAATATLPRPAVWELPPVQQREWIVLHGGRMAMAALTIASAVVLLFVRPRDRTAQLVIVTLALCAVSALGPLRGSETVLGTLAGRVLTVFAWISTAMAMPFVSIAIAHFPRPDAYLRDRRWLLTIPFAATAPMIVAGSGTALFLAGWDATGGLANWDADHARVYYIAFAAGLALNMLAAFDAWRRFRGNQDVNERRRVQLATTLLIPGVVAYGVYEGLPAVSAVLTGERLALPSLLAFPLQLIAGLPAVGLAYAVAVNRVMSPAVALRRGMQYALARRTLTILTLLPAVALVVSLVRQRNLSLADIVAGRPLFYSAALAMLILGLRYRTSAMAWLDRRFFREQYDARRVLLSLAGRVPFETDPQELTALVVRQVEAALHPRRMDVLVGGLDEGRLIAVSHPDAQNRGLAVSGALATMLRWSAEPLELDLNDTRSPARRLPSDEQDWLLTSRAVLLVPIFAGQGSERKLVGALALGEKRSEEPYTGEDKELLASIAAQVGLALDVARLRQRQAWTSDTAGSRTTITPSAVALMVECPACGRCEDGETDRCPDDRTPMRVAGGVPRVIEAKYRIDWLLGRGGMGAVYRARDVRLERDVAIKMVRPELLADSDARTRFRREAQIIAGLQHPALVAVFDYGTLPDGGAYLVMEFVRGRDLRRILRSEKRLDPKRVVRLIRAVCAGMEVAHGAGVLHRDLKPENIMLPDSGVEAKVLDFGIAKVVGERRLGSDHETLTVVGQPIGTPAYMAPEQLAAGPLSPQTDVFSLGVITYELLNGELPFGRGSLLEIADRQRAGAQPLDQSDPSIPRALQEAVISALAIDPGSRPASAAAFAAILQAAFGPARV